MDDMPVAKTEAPEFAEFEDDGVAHLRAQNPNASLDDVEMWQATTPSTIWLQVQDHAAGSGAWKSKRVGGPSGSKKIQLTVRERRFNEDQVPEEAIQHDPFANGMLICISGGATSRNALTDEHIISILQIEGDEVFEQAVQSIDSEVLLRRLWALSKTRASHLRFEFLGELIMTRYRVGGTQRTIRELQEAEARG